MHYDKLHDLTPRGGGDEPSVVARLPSDMVPFGLRVPDAAGCPAGAVVYCAFASGEWLLANRSSCAASHAAIYAESRRSSVGRAADS